MAQTPQTQPLTNRIMFDDLVAVAKELGAEAGKGKDTQIKFLLKAVDGGYHGAVDLTSNKHGPDRDDATLLSEAYVQAQQGSVIFDAKAANQRKLVSTVRTAIKLGGWPKGGNGEPVATVQNLMTMRQNLKKVPAEAKKLNDAANTLLNYARAQLKRDQLIDDDELKGFCYKKGHELPTAEDIIEQCAKKLDNLISGKAASNTVQNNSKNIVDARQALRRELAAIATARGGQGPQSAPAKPKKAPAAPALAPAQASP